MSFFRCAPTSWSSALVVAVLISGPGLANSSDFHPNGEPTLALADDLAALGTQLSDLRRGAADLTGEHRRLMTQVAQTQLAQTQLAQTGGLSAGQAAQFERRLSALESELRRITGRIEDADFGVRQLGQRMDRFESETKARLLRLEQGQPAAGAQTPTASFTPLDGSGPTVVGSAGTPTAGTPPVGTATADPGGAATPTGQGQPAPLEPRSLGTISDQALAATRQGAAAAGAATGAPGQQQALAPATQLPSDDPQAAYNSAFELLRQMNYPAAESAFGQYLDLFPDSNLAGNAKYWLGETHYVRGDYETAAVVFAEGYQSYPDSGKAPDNLLKLGMSLSNLGATEDACATFSELQRRYSNAAPTVLQRALRESQRLGCS